MVPRRGDTLCETKRGGGRAGPPLFTPTPATQGAAAVSPLGCREPPQYGWQRRPRRFVC